MNVIKLCRKENIANHEEEQSGFHLGSLLYLPLNFFFLDLPWWCKMLTPTDLIQPVLIPVMSCHWLSPSTVNMVTLHSAVRFKHCRAGQNPSRGRGYCFPSGYCPLEGSSLPEHKGCCHLGVTQHQDPCCYSPSSLPKASILCLSSGISSPLCPHLYQSPS